MKKVIIVLSILIFLALSAYLYFFHLQPIKKNNPLMAVPADASMIFQMDNPFEQWSKITNNTIWNYLKSNPFFAELGQEMDSMNAEMKSNQGLWELLMERPMVMSIHKTRPKDYDFLYIVDLQRATQFNFVKNYIKDLSDDIDRVFTRTYHEKEIIEFTFTDSPTTYYLSIHENLLSISSTHTIIEQSIDQLAEPVLIRDLDFIDISKELSGNDIKMYINYKPFAEYLKIWMDDSEQESLDILKVLKYSGMTLEATDDVFSVEGFSSLQRDNPNLLTALMKSGEGKIEVGTIVPDNASYFMSVGFDDALGFYGQMEEVLKAAEDESYMDNKAKIEKYLNISIKDDFISWMDNEIALIQLNSNSSKNKVELAFAIKHKGFDEAKERLNFIEQQIKKKTPVKFKGINYKGHDIQFLSIKGFFKLLFGKAFEDIDKPYYTIMDDYVVFSNSPRTLGKIITAVEEQKTLDHTKEYAVFMENFAYESNLFIYLSAVELLSDAERLLEAESWKDLTAHMPYFKSFPMMGMQFISDGNLMRHQLQMNYLNHEQVNNWNDLVKENSFIVDDVLDTTQTEEEDYISIENILPEDLNSKSFMEYYDNEQVKFEVSLKDGLKHGRYFQYDSLGNMLVKGRYRDDEKSGTWRYYDEHGDLIKKERF
jgi:antitoxin component YwqK of YwqJK toxin-antitoxin module